jgi:hypothetical protein
MYQALNRQIRNGICNLPMFTWVLLLVNTPGVF